MFDVISCKGCTKGVETLLGARKAARRLAALRPMGGVDIYEGHHILETWEVAEGSGRDDLSFVAVVHHGHDYDEADEVGA